MTKKRHYEALFFDLDDTLLSFSKASKAAFRAVFEEQGLPYSPRLFARYEVINLAYWKNLEKGLVTMEVLSYQRFEDLFREFSIDADPHLIGERYFYHLQFQHQKMPYMASVLRELRKRGYLLYVITNGEARTQKRRYHDSGLDKLTERQFISGEMGCKKPDVRYFEIIEETVRIPRENILLIGDSLSSDISGGKNYGIDTCWMTPENTPEDPAVLPDYRISELRQLLDILP
ncbi:MAG: YjjG family noncanonical pyrimidine nucleotidase [Erysipelotrichales bacterium]|nr:YjjG family noncanonical pyrimidine nucleotidase [Erysipelotrichales bacterium]